jgi:fatty acid desaturase
MSEVLDRQLVATLERVLDAEGRALLDRREVPTELLVRSTLLGLIRDAVVAWGVIAVCLVGMYGGSNWLYPIWALIVAGRIHALGVFCHDAIHLPLPLPLPLRGKSGRLQLFEFLAVYPIATTLPAIRYHHLRHHRDSGMPTDPYFKAGVDQHFALWCLQWLRGALLMPFWTIRPYVGVIALCWPGLRPVYGRWFLQDRSGLPIGDSTELLVCARAEPAQLLFQLPLLYCLFAGVDGVIFGLILPMWFSGLLASYRVLCEHRYVRVSDRRVETILSTTNDHHLRLWHRLFLAPANVGCHVVHHLHPQVGWRSLPALRNWYRHRLGAAYPGPNIS